MISTRPTVIQLSSFFRSLSSKLKAFPTISRNMSTRTYKDAVELLNSLQSNAAALEAARASGGRSSEFAIPEMLEYLGRIGYSVRV
jgi:folylpolyglutamate synthase